MQLSEQGKGLPLGVHRDLDARPLTLQLADAREQRG
jgi:hypothetical protein